MKSEILFSIIIPSYNRANLISDTLKSVVNQNYQYWECIIVDDGSTDNTKEVVEEIIKKEARIKYIYQTNAERSAARNRGINAAIGDYICFLDSDDSFESNHLEILKNEIEKSTIKKTVFFTNYRLYSIAGFREVEIEKNTNNLVHYLCYNPIIPARVCCHRKILEEFQFDEDIVVVEDLVLWLKIAQKYPFYHIDNVTVNYHMHEDNSVNLKNTGYQKRLDGLIKFKKRYTNIWNKIEKVDQEYLIGNTYFGIAKHFIVQNKKSKAILYLLKSILTQKKHSQLKHKVFLIKELLLGKQVGKYIN